MVKPIDLSIIILSYNTQKILYRTLEALHQAINYMKIKGYSCEVIVVDNGSTDGSCELVKNNFSSFDIIVLSENKGFPGGNNIGIKKSTGRYILLLNSDVLVENNTLERMILYMDDNTDVGVATCKLIFPNGDIDPACHRGFPTAWTAFTYFSGLEKLFPHSRWFSSYHLGFLPINTTHEIDSPTGAFYFIRKEVIDQVGLLDEDYFMYGEDLDWSYRIKKAGWKVMYIPQIKTVHIKKQSGRESKDKQAQRRSTVAFYDTMKIFYKKHFNQQYPSIFMWLIFLCIDIKKTFALNSIRK